MSICKLFNEIYNIMYLTFFFFGLLAAKTIFIISEYLILYVILLHQSFIFI